jgi:hypothetical protein
MYLLIVTSIAKLLITQDYGRDLVTFSMTFLRSLGIETVQKQIFYIQILGRTAMFTQREEFTWKR